MRCIVTGGGSGIGQATARLLSSRGARVLVWDRLPVAVSDLTGTEGGQSWAMVGAITVDQSRPSEVESALSRSVVELGGIDLLHANAGVAFFSPFLDLTQKQWQLSMAVNLTGTFTVCQAVARQMIKQRTKGSIVVTTSISSELNSNELLHYCVGKAGLRMLVRGMAAELGPSQIRVNGVAPSVILTPMTSDLLKDDVLRRRVLDTIPLGREGEAREVASVVAFLASSEASYITGQNISVCGGETVASMPPYRPATAPPLG
ncbi:MAG: SDR family NAD(P)-dependent oxidoreductase [Candidatus Dormibacteria bacterium]